MKPALDTTIAWAPLVTKCAVPLLLLLSAFSSKRDQDRMATLERQNMQLEQQIRVLTANKKTDVAAAESAVPDNEVYTLYRSSPFTPELRVHVGTFDTRAFDEPAQNKKYNYEMCSDAQLNFNERNRGNELRFWCEEGRFRAKLR